MAELLYRLGRFSARRAWTVIVGWLVVLGLAGGAAQHLERHRVEQELGLERQLAESVDQFGRHGFGSLFVIASGLILAQLVIANLWLRVFATGPAEWLWKSLSYAKLQPFGRGPEPLS